MISAWSDSWVMPWVLSAAVKASSVASAGAVEAAASAPSGATASARPAVNNDSRLGLQIRLFVISDTPVKEKSRCLLTTSWTASAALTASHQSMIADIAYLATACRLRIGGAEVNDI